MRRCFWWAPLALTVLMSTALAFGCTRSPGATAARKQIQHQYNDSMNATHQALHELRYAQTSQGEERQQAILRASWRLCEGVGKLESLLRLYPKADTAKAGAALTRLRAALVGLQYIALQGDAERLDDIHALVLQVSTQFPAQVETEVSMLRALH